MAWTTPRTWSFGELVTAALLNTHIRDNLNILKTSVANDGKLAFNPKCYNTTLSSISNSTTPTLIASWTVPANELATGNMIDFPCLVDVFNNTGSSQNVTFTAYYGGTTVDLGSTLSFSSSATHGIVFARLHMARVSSTLYVRFTGTNPDDVNFTTNAWAASTNTVNMAPTFSADATVGLRVTLGTASPNLSATMSAGRAVHYPQGL